MAEQAGTPRAWGRPDRSPGPPRQSRAPRPVGVVLRVDGVALDAALAVPDNPLGVVLFAHGSGSSRHSPRNRAVARVLAEAGFGTVLTDLLTPSEEREDARTGRWRFDIELLARRVTGAVDHIADRAGTAGLPIGVFGASTGAAAALAAAAERPELVRAVVSRGGRPDLAGRWLERVVTPTLLVVGALDEEVLDLNRQAATALGGRYRLHVVDGATHLFSEPGALEEVAGQAVDWFGRHLAAGRAAEG